MDQTAPDAAPAAPPAPAVMTMPLGMFVFTLLYGGMTVLAGVLAFKQVQLWPTSLAVESGIFPFLLLVVISSTLSQLYGREAAKRIVWWGFFPLGLSALLMQLVLGLPASGEMIAFRPDDLAAFERVHQSTWRVWMAGPASYITSLLLNIWIFDRLRGSGEETTLRPDGARRDRLGAQPGGGFGDLHHAGLLRRVRHHRPDDRAGAGQGGAFAGAGAVPDHLRRARRAAARRARGLICTLCRSACLEYPA
jgi:uncharacterized integral membrane protein (TIGR00697 family)